MTLLTPSHSFPLPLPHERTSRNMAFASNDSFQNASGLSAASTEPSASRPVSNGGENNTALLSPPVNTFKAPRRSRQSKHTAERARTSVDSLQDEDTGSATSEDEAEDPDSDTTSYTRSFRPFSYHSTPYLEVSQIQKPTDIPRPQPPLCKSSYFIVVFLLKVCPCSSSQNILEEYP